MRQVVLTSRPRINPLPSDFAVQQAEVGDAGPGQLKVKTLWLSLDPYVRLNLDEKPVGSSRSVNLGEAPIGRAVARVEASNSPDFAVGDLVEGRVPWAEYAVLDANPGLRKVQAGHGGLSHAVGALGMPGQTAYAGMIDIGRIKAGETAVINAAAGAVGLLAGQIGKLKGARVVGIAGGPAKCAAVEAAGFDACIDYKAADFAGRVAAALPDGVDLLFENVGSAQSLEVLKHARYGARMPVCGLISIYATGDEQGHDHFPDFMRLIFAKGLEVKAFVGELTGGQKALDEIQAWIEAGRLDPVQTIVEGIDQVPNAFAGIYGGNDNIGKLVVKVAQDA